MKIKEINKLKTVLPFSLKESQKYIPTGVDGLDSYVLKDPTVFDEVMGFLPCRSILIKGPAGAGKTTFGLQIIVNNIKKFKRALFITFQETSSQLKKDYQAYGWEINRDIVLRLESTIEPIELYNRLIKIIDDKMLDIVVIDNLSRLKLWNKNAKEDFRKNLEDFLITLRVRGVTVFSLWEEENKEYRPEEFVVDGVIVLGSEEKKRFLEITKLRGQYYARGRHSLQICGKQKIKVGEKVDIDWLSEGINVFPNIETYGDTISYEE